MDPEKSFGFGCMRLPVLNAQDNTTFDFDTIETLFDAYMALGFTYFDTAYTYHSYRGERAVRQALVERNARDSFELASKLPLRDFKDPADMERIFFEQLSNCGVEYFDYYLLHNMGMNVYAKCVKYDAFGFVRRMKAAGRIRQVGMSFHDQPALLEKILSFYADCLDFIQLQINYVDWEQPSVQSRRCLEIARKYGKPVTVMEPCKGGTLVNLPAQAEALFRQANPGASNASWALRFAASCEGVTRVLSGMNSLEQVEDNCATFLNFKPLTEEERSVIEQVRQILEADAAIPCTGCGYCVQGCPKKIAIPQYFSLYNSILRTTGSFSSQSVYYQNLCLTHGKASECVLCRQCERACPQHLPVTEYLKDVVVKLEQTSIHPVRK